MRSVGINEAFIGRTQASEALDQCFRVKDNVRARSQHRVMHDHTRKRDPQAQFEAVVIELLGRAVTVIGFKLEAFVARGAGISANWQGHRIDRLYDCIGLTTDDDQTFLDGGFHLPEISRLTKKTRAG